MTAAIRRALLRFYDRRARDLPWRRSRDPYAIWVSEVMLQQTRVDTVLRYYDRFLERFPTPRALAVADEADVMAAWSGLGYYRRARLLHRGVREVVEAYGGQVPRDAEARRGLPGVGRYTAGAIGSIAFDLAEPLVDGNVARVLSRLFAIETPQGRADTERQLWSIAEKLVRGTRPGDFNQALMELGATVCTKHAPACDDCPVARHCQARAQGREQELPLPRKRASPRPVAMVAVVPVGAGRLWLSQRPVGSLFAGLWNLPMGERAEVDARDSARALLSEVGLSARLGDRPVGELSHVLSHRRLDVQLWRATGARPRARTRTDARAFSRAEVADLGLSALTRRALSAAGFGS